jgi:hypothetical protein
MMNNIKLWIALNKQKLLLPILIVTILAFAFSTYLIRSPFDIEEEKIVVNVISHFKSTAYGGKTTITAKSDNGKSYVVNINQKALLQKNDRIEAQKYRNIFTGNTYYLYLGKINKNITKRSSGTTKTQVAP